MVKYQPQPLQPFTVVWTSLSEHEDFMAVHSSHTMAHSALCAVNAIHQTRAEVKPLVMAVFPGHHTNVVPKEYTDWLSVPDDGTPPPDHSRAEPSTSSIDDEIKRLMDAAGVPSLPPRVH